MGRISTSWLRQQASCNAVAVLLAYAVCSILLIFINKTILSTLRSSRTPSHSAEAETDEQHQQQQAAHFSLRSVVALVDYDVLQVTSLQCAFTALAVRVILRCVGGRGGATQPRFGLHELVTSNLFVAMLLTSNLCVKLIPVSVLPVSRSLTFLFVLALDRLMSYWQPETANAKGSQSLFSARRCVVYALVLFGYVGAVEPGKGKPREGECSLLGGIACGVINSLITALTSLSMRVTMRKRSEEARREAETRGGPLANGCDVSVALCYTTNLYTGVLGLSVLLGCRLLALLSDPAAQVTLQQALSALLQADWHALSLLVPSFAVSHSLVDWRLVGLYASSSVSGVLVSTLNLVQLQLCAPLTIQIANATKSVVLTMLAVVYYSEQHALVWYAANASMVIGTLLYATEPSVPTPASTPAVTVSTPVELSQSVCDSPVDENNNWELPSAAETDSGSCSPCYAEDFTDCSPVSSQDLLVLANAKLDISEELLAAVEKATGDWPQIASGSVLTAGAKYAALLSEARLNRQTLLKRAMTIRARSRSRTTLHTEKASLKNLHVVKKRH